MGNTGTSERARRAGRSVYTASQRVGRAGVAAAGSTGRFVHRVSGASGAGRTGLSNLIELTAAGGVGDAFVAVALAGTLFFSTSVGHARGRVALALLITIAPYAILAPLIGPLLDRVKHGNRYILTGTLLARGLLCWGMAAGYNDAVTLLPAALGVLVLQKAYGVTRAAVTPRLLPSEITLVTANARLNLGSLIATSVGAVVALGLDKIAGGDGSGAAWVLRVATAIYLAATILGLRLPERVDAQPGDEHAADGSPAGQVIADAHGGPSPNGHAATDTAVGPTGTRVFDPGTAAMPAGSMLGAATAGNTTAAGPGTGRARRPGSGLRGLLTPPQVGHVAAEAIRVNAAIRVFYGFLLFFLVFILRSERFGHTPETVALGGLAIAVAVGGMLGTSIGSALRARNPQAMMFTILGLATVVAIACAVFFGLWSVLAVALAAAISQTLVKVALDSILQREIPPQTRSSTFAFSETLHQLALVGGGLVGLLLSLTGSGFAGLTVAACGLALALCWLILDRRRRILRTRQTPAASVR